MKLNEILNESVKALVVYHGTSKKFKSALKTPLFVTTKKSAAKWYAENSAFGSSSGVVLKGTLNVHKTLDATDDDYNEMQSIATQAKIKWWMEKDMYFQCDEISKHSPYDGSNPMDLVYIPAFVKELQHRGYDSIHADDGLENGTADTYILFKSSQFVIDA